MCKHADVSRVPGVNVMCPKQWLKAVVNQDGIFLKSWLAVSMLASLDLNTIKTL